MHDEISQFFPLDKIGRLFLLWVVVREIVSFSVFDAVIVFGMGVRLIGRIKNGLEAINFRLEEIFSVIAIHMFPNLLLHLKFCLVLGKLLLKLFALVFVFL